jgi:TPP-dependent pyruvate/acetoin dehydrogenase alpha subunit
VANLYRKMLEIRLFEERILQLFAAGKISGTTHTCIGQEPIAVVVAAHLRETDMVFASHRCHGHYLARTGDMEGLLAEIMGRAGGVCGGRGGSQHLHKGNFFSWGVQGGYLPIAVGAALAEKKLGTETIVVAFIGDGTFGEGAVYEALNMASLWGVPLLVVVEDNGYAQSTSAKLGIAGDLVERAESFDILASESSGWNVVDLYERFGWIIDRMRSLRRPHVEVVSTYRLAAHSKGDDVRDPAQIDAFWVIDPVTVCGLQAPEEERELIREQIIKKLDSIQAVVEAMPCATLNP